MRRWLAAVFVLLWAASAAAQNQYKPVCDKKNRRLCAQAVLEGERVPFSGQLLTTELALRQAQKVEHCDARLEIEIQYEKEQSKVKLQLERQLRLIDAESHEAQIELLQDRLKQAHNRPLLEHPVVVATLAVVLTLGALYGGVQVVQVAGR